MSSICWIILITATAIDTIEGFTTTQCENDIGNRNWQQISNRRKRIVGGEMSQAGEWPWSVSLMANKYGTFVHMCGGTLIDPQWILTASHCFRPFPGYMFLSDDPNIWLARLGEHDMRDETIPHVDAKVSQVFVLPNGTIFGEHDIALLKLEEPATLNEYVDVVCLPENGEDVPEGTKCYTAGWGNFNAGKEEFQLKALHHVDVAIVSASKCNESYVSLKEQKNRNLAITDNMICAGHENGGKDACSYDSGGPLVCKSNDVWVHVGIVSYGEECALAEYPGVYTKVSRYMDWIKKVQQGEIS
jgi:secreted trypsin-like serine protease